MGKTLVKAKGLNLLLRINGSTYLEKYQFKDFTRVKEILVTKELLIEIFLSLFSFLSFLFH